MCLQWIEVWIVRMYILKTPCTLHTCGTTYTQWMDIDLPVQSLLKDVYPEHCITAIAYILCFLIFGQARLVLLVPGLFLLKFISFLL